MTKYFHWATLLPSFARLKNALDETVVDPDDPTEIVNLIPEFNTRLMSDENKLHSDE